MNPINRSTSDSQILPDIFTHRCQCCFSKVAVLCQQCCSVISAGCNVVFVLQLSTIHSSYSDSGLFGVQAVSTPENIGKVSFIAV